MFVAMGAGQGLHSQKEPADPRPRKGLVIPAASLGKPVVGHRNRLEQ